MRIAKGTQKFDLHIEVSIAPQDKEGFTNFTRIEIEPGHVIKSITVSHNYVPKMKTTRSVAYSYYAPRTPDSEEEPVLIFRKTEELNMAIYDYNYE